MVALLVSYNNVKRFAKGEKPMSALELSVELKLPIRLLNEILFELVRCKVLIEVAGDANTVTSYQPALKKISTGESRLRFQLNPQLHVI